MNIWVIGLKQEEVSTSSWTSLNLVHLTLRLIIQDEVNIFKKVEFGHVFLPESVSSHSSFIEEFIGSGRKDKRFFWQYNTQSKGPKGKRLAKALDPEDPHILNDFEDPVFDPDQQQMKYKHNGKARRGDGNDITPNPYRLFQIGNELSKLNKQINSIVPVVEMPQVARNKKRKEKNKFASRACRLKKKAQHEANKLKLYGLDQEHCKCGWSCKQSVGGARSKKWVGARAQEWVVLETECGWAWDRTMSRAHREQMIMGAGLEAKCK